jgi:hypothetical protein
LELQTHTFLRLLLLLGLTAAPILRAQTAEINLWPAWVARISPDRNDAPEEWTAAGPLLFAQNEATPDKPGQTAHGFRPFYVQKHDAASGTSATYFLYPVFTYYKSPYGNRWSFLSLINRSTDSRRGHALTAAEREQTQRFDLWPFYFSRQTGSPETSYRAVMPLYGTVKNRFAMDRISWVLFPLYAEFDRRGVVTTTAPWPLIKILKGDGNHGFEFWPLFGRRAKEGAYREQFYFWPLTYKDEHGLWKAEPDVRLGVLPFYTRETRAGSRSETYVWPLFGYTDRTTPDRYHETRYLWPLLVQGRGDLHYVNRWAPFYTHSNHKGIERTWVLWPLWRRLTWEDPRLRHTKTHVLYWLYHSSVQESVRNPSLLPAHKTHVWPLVSSWNNGAGQKQVEALSPLTVFFPGNDGIRLAYSPLFAVYRYDRQANGSVRHSALWNLVTYARQPEHREFHLGPLFSSEKSPKHRRVAFGCGLLGFKRKDPASSWRFFAFEFRRRAAKDGRAQP